MVNTVDVSSYLVILQSSTDLVVDDLTSSSADYQIERRPLCDEPPAFPPYYYKLYAANN